MIHVTEKKIMENIENSFLLKIYIKIKKLNKINIGVVIKRTRFDFHKKI